MKHSRSSLFLMELILAILFFSIASAVCIQLFAKSHTLSKRTIDQNNALIQAQNLAEGFLASEGNLEQVADLFPLSVLDPATESITLCFDGNWNPIPENQAFFCAMLQKSNSTTDGLITADIFITECSDDSSPIYTLQIKQHIPAKK